MGFPKQERKWNATASKMSDYLNASTTGSAPSSVNTRIWDSLQLALAPLVEVSTSTQEGFVGPKAS